MSDVTEALKSHYRSSYGRSWHPAAPDFTRCCENVRTPVGATTDFHQCLRKRGFGPDGAYCKQHDPSAAQARREASRARYVEQTNKLRYGWSGRTFYDALKQIAEGHNDARGLAQQVIADFHKDDVR